MAGTHAAHDIPRTFRSPLVIDLHLHLLPAVDDGAADAAVTLAMLEVARSLGFHTLVATPHLPDPLTPEYASRIASALDRTREAAIPFGIAVAQGFEVALSPDLVHRLKRGEPSTLGGGISILVDLPFAGWPHHTETSLFALQTAGYRPVLAHPERYRAVQDDPARAISLAERGVLLQINLPSLTGMFGAPARRTAEILLRAGAVHLAASDAHSAGHRYAAVPGGIARLRDLVGEDGAHRMLQDAPAVLLAGDPIPPAPRSASTAAGEGWWGRTRRKIGLDRG